MNQRLLVGLAAVAALLLAGCSDDEKGGSSLPPADMVGVWASKFDPNAFQCERYVGMTQDGRVIQKLQVLKVEANGASSQLMVSVNGRVSMKALGQVNAAGTNVLGESAKSEVIAQKYPIVGGIKQAAESQGQSVLTVVTDQLSLSLDRDELLRKLSVSLLVDGVAVPSNPDEVVYTKLTEESYQRHMNKTRRCVRQLVGQVIPQHANVINGSAVDNGWNNDEWEEYELEQEGALRRRQRR